MFSINTARKRFDFDHGIELFGKTKPGKIKLEEAKKLQNAFKSHLNEIHKWEEQDGAIKWLLIKSLKDYQ